MKKSEKGLLEAKANVLKALGHPTRLWLAEQLAGGEKCVCELAEQIDADFSTVSKHLAVLKQAGVVADQKRGKQVYYSLKVPCILKYMPCIETVVRTQIEEQVHLLRDDLPRPLPPRR
ncbi:MAG: metalloregulator ArsR/SmtB family transcription factor [Desulforhopalus sp.]|jgi:ArsR family transcriptional regulator|nr:metalloregulator ArsR/SmtB family transcription factor [Desulforhopalus sp.]